MNQRGAALVATLAIVMVLLPLGALAVFQCRTDLLIQHNLRAEVEAFYVAEAGLEHAVSEIPPGISFDSILAGPDHRAGSADDGMFPFVEGAPAAFPRVPLHYDVRVTAAGGNVISVVSTGSGLNGASKVVSALVTRSTFPVTPAALYAEGDTSGTDVSGAGLLLSGLDHRIGDAPSTPTGDAASVPAFGSTQDDTESMLRQRLSGTDAQRLVGAGGQPSVATTLPLGVDRYAAAAQQRTERVDLGGPVLDGAMTLGTPVAPQLSVAAGDLDISGSVTGLGVLVVQGTLHVSGALSFTGLLLALGGIVCDPSSTITLAGGLWRAGSADSRLQLRGGGAIMYSAEALARADAAFPGLLPHAAVVAGWFEQM